MSTLNLPVTSTRHWTVARILVALVAIFTFGGALIADALSPMAAQHILNPAWSPHAKFHDAQYIVMSMLLGALALMLLARKRGDGHAALLTAAGALLVLGTAVVLANRSRGEGTAAA